MAIQLRLAEKMILEKALASGRTKRLHFQKKLQEGAPLPCYDESNIALLENTDAKLPILLSKLGEIKGQESQLEDHIVENAVYGKDMEGNRQSVQLDIQEMSGNKEVRKDVKSKLDSVETLAPNGQREVASLSASRI